MPADSNAGNVAIVTVAVIALALALAGSVGALVYVTRKLVTATDLSSQREVASMAAHYKVQAQVGIIETLRTESGARGRALAAVQEKLDVALAELHDRTTKELVTAAPGDVPTLVGRMLDERREARRAVSRAAGHSSEPAGVPTSGAGSGSVGEIETLR